MAKEIIMPKMGNTVESVIMGDINVKIGDKIAIGDLLFEYETDKSTSEYKSEVDGEILAILVESGDEVPVLVNVIIVGKKGEDVSKYLTTPKEVEITPITTTTKEISKEEKNTSEFVTNNTNINTEFSSPRAKETAKSLGIELNTVNTASGANGRIVEKDILNMYHNDQNFEIGKISKLNSPDKEFERVNYTGMRVAIAKAMENSIQSGAQLSLGAPMDATALLAARKYIKNNHVELGIANATINDIVIYVLARVLVKFPHINSIMGDKYIDAYNVAHISVAVDSPKGLLVPVVENASLIGISDIALKTKELYGKALKGKLSAKEQSGGTFTISNLGLSGVSFFTPILNPPQSALLGVGSPITRLKFDEHKNVIEYSEITLALTMDHRPFDGAQGAEFLKALVSALENLDIVKLIIGR